MFKQMHSTLAGKLVTRLAVAGGFAGVLALAGPFGAPGAAYAMGDSSLCAVAPYNSTPACIQRQQQAALQNQLANARAQQALLLLAQQRAQQEAQFRAWLQTSAGQAYLTQQRQQALLRQQQQQQFNSYVVAEINRSWSDPCYAVRTSLPPTALQNPQIQQMLQAGACYNVWRIMNGYA